MLLDTQAALSIMELLASEVRIAATRVYADCVHATPLLHSPAFSKLSAGPLHVFLKLESEQVTGSFKARGAANRLLALTPAERTLGIVTASTGNHALAVAHALNVAPSLKGIPAEIYLPRSVAPAKLKRLRDAGAPLRIVDVDDCIGSEMAALARSKETGRIYVSPYADILVAAGQGTAGLEICEQLSRAARQFPDVANHPLVVLVPVGGGGLSSGVAAIIKAERRNSIIIGTQPAGNACMLESVRAGRILLEGQYADGATLSDGTAGGIEADSFTFAACRGATTTPEDVAARIDLVRRRSCAAAATEGSTSTSTSTLAPHDETLVDGLLLVSEEEIERAIVAMLDSHSKVVEGAAGTALAALVKYGHMFQRCTVVVLCCGSNIALETLTKILQRHHR